MTNLLLSNQHTLHSLCETRYYTPHTATRFHHPHHMDYHKWDSDLCQGQVLIFWVFLKFVYIFFFIFWIDLASFSFCFSSFFLLRSSAFAFFSYSFGSFSSCALFTLSIASSDVKLSPHPVNLFRL